MEQIVNAYATTLSSSYTMGSGSISVTSATGAPASGTFSLIIADASTGALILIFRVTSVSGTTFNGAAEGPDADAAGLSLVYGSDLSVAALSQIAADLNGYGTISSRPATPLLTGARYVASDSVYDEARWNGSSWDQFVAGMKCTQPLSTNFATAAAGANATEDSFANANDGLIWQGHAAAGNNLLVRAGAYPTPPWRKRLRWRHNHIANSYEHSGLCLYDTGTGNAIVYGFGLRDTPGVEIILYEWSGGLTTPSNYVNQVGFPFTFRGGAYEIWVGDDSTNRNIYLVQDGHNPVQLYQESNTSYITPNKLGFGLLPYTQTFSPSSIMTILDWSDV